MFRFATGFDHCAKNVNDTWIPVSGVNITRYNPTTGKPIIVDSDGWLTTTAGVSNTTETSVSLDLGPYFGANNAAKAIFGFRIKNKTGDGTGNLISFLPTGSGVNYHWTLGWADLPAALRVAGAEFYMEMELNTSTNQVLVFVNKVQVGASQAAGPISDAVKTGLFWATLVLTSGGGSEVHAIKDLYVADNIAGDGVVTRLGDLTLYPLVIDTVDQTNWTPSNSGGNAVSILNAMTVPGTEGDVMSTKSAGSALEAGLSIAGVPADAVIHGISVTVSAKVDPSSSTAKFSLKNGTTSTPDTNFAPGVTTMKYGHKVGAYAKQPDGSAWTLAAIDATKVVAKLG